MADTKLSALTELAATPANDDEVYIRDVSEAAANESKRITIANLLASLGGMELVDEASPSVAAEVEFTGLNGELFLLLYTLFCSAASDLRMSLNGISSADYEQRRFEHGTTFLSETAQSVWTITRLDASNKASGYLMVEGKRVSAANNLHIGHFGFTDTTVSDMIIDGRLVASGGDLTSIRIWPFTGNLTGEIKVYKVV